MARFVVLPAHVLERAQQVEADDWKGAVKQAAESVSGSGRYLCVPEGWLKAARVDTTTEASARVTEE